MDLFLKRRLQKLLDMGEVEDLVIKFNELNSTLKKVFSKAVPLLVVSLIFDECQQEPYLHSRNCNEIWA